MRTVEIITSQNVVVRYRIATTIQRVAAFLIDYIVLGILVIIINLNLREHLWFFFLAALIVFFYTLISEVFFNGHTLGKYMLGIRVAKLDGSEPTFADYFGRWATRIIEIHACFGIIAVILASTSKRGQRLGDSISGTVLIQIKHTSPYRLQSIAELANATNYEPTYPGIVHLTENEVIQIKRLVDQYELHPSKSTRSLVQKVGMRLQKRLDIHSKVKADERFLKDLIKEYVILSR